MHVPVLVKTKGIFQTVQEFALPFCPISTAGKVILAPRFPPLSRVPIGKEVKLDFYLLMFYGHSRKSVCIVLYYIKFWFLMIKGFDLAFIPIGTPRRRRTLVSIVPPPSGCAL